MQIENEYGPMEYEIGAAGKAYTKWAAEMAMELGTGVPWIMCKQDDTPDPLVSSDEVHFLRKHFIFYICISILFIAIFSWVGILSNFSVLDAVFNASKVFNF